MGVCVWQQGHQVLKAGPLNLNTYYLKNMVGSS